MPFNKSLIVVASTRYEIGRHDPRRWKAWNANLKAIAAHPRNIVAANNRYDAEYVKYFTGLSHVPVLPNYCGWRCGNQPRVDGVASPWNTPSSRSWGLRPRRWRGIRQTSRHSVDVHAGGYTGVTYNPTRRQILVGPGRGVKDHFVQQLDAAARGKRFQNQPLQFKRIRDLYPHFEYSDLAAHPCIVLIPYQVSLMSDFRILPHGHPDVGAGARIIRAVAAEVPSHVGADLGFSEEEAAHTRKSSTESARCFPQTRPERRVRHQSHRLLDQVRGLLRVAPHFYVYFVRRFGTAADGSVVGPARMSQKVIAYNEEMVRDLKSEWRSIFAKMFRGLQPAASEPREQKRNYDEALLAKYGARQSDRCASATRSSFGAASTLAVGAAGFWRPFWVFFCFLYHRLPVAYFFPVAAVAAGLGTRVNRLWGVVPSLSVASRIKGLQRSISF